MNYYSINNPAVRVSLKTAVLQSISGESGLYMPERVPELSAAFLRNLPGMSLKEIGMEVSKAMLGEDIPEPALRAIVEGALNFPIPLRKLDDGLYVLELFHGPTLAFKDVGARFMAGLFNYLLSGENREVTILVATSGDTGGAVANAFHNRQGVRVVILYPSGRVSPLQELQLTTMGGNVSALEVEGDFDACQRMVKQAFADPVLNEKLNLTSANSINFARLFPQSFCYFHAAAQLGSSGKPLVFSIPSGNFGNLTALLMAKRMGLPVHRIIAATNSNHAVPDYLATGRFTPEPTRYTISNAMDVGNPSNFPRMLALYGGSHEAMANDVAGCWFNDEQTRSAIHDIHHRYGYLADPHGAIAYAGLKHFGIRGDFDAVFVETAHPAKFPDEVGKAAGISVKMPDAINGLGEKRKESVRMAADYAALAGYLTGK
jgi:threonine synthase